jgi:ornithine cyclodeaminase
MIVLSNDDLLGLVPPADLIAAVEAAARAVARGDVVVPERTHSDWADNTFLTMPAMGGKYFGTKLVSVIPSNSVRSLPVTNGLMVLNDGETGLPLAIMNAAALTAQRTGGVGALGVKYMTPADTSSVGIIGCGVQGAWQAIFACSLRPIREIFCVDRSQATFERFSATVRARVPEARIVFCGDSREVLDRTQLVIAATTSSQPVLPDEPNLLENKHFISVGSFRRSMQELPDSVYRLAGRLAVDSDHARHEVGDVINAIERGILDEGRIYSIAECISGACIVDTSRTTAYKAVGMAAYDLFAAEMFYKAAMARGVGQRTRL